MSPRKHPKVYEIVLQALTRLGDVKGSSVRNIIDLVRSAINENNVLPRPRNVATLVRHALRHGLEMGHLEQRSGRYKIRVNSSSITKAMSGGAKFAKGTASKSGPSKSKSKSKPKPKSAQNEEPSVASSRSYSRSQSNASSRVKSASKKQSLLVKDPGPSRYQTRSRTAAARAQQEAARSSSKTSSLLQPRNRDNKHRGRKSQKNKNVKRPSKSYRQRGPPMRRRRRGAQLPNDSVNFLRNSANPFSINIDWGVDDDDEDMDVSSNKSK